VIFFDIDGTLLNYNQAERLAAISFKKGVDVCNDIADEKFAEKWRKIAEKHISSYLEGQVSFTERRRARIRQ